MALRPVSELGLVEVTDVADRDQTHPAPSPSDDPGTADSRTAQIAASVLSGGVGLAGALLVGRAILRR